MSEPSAFRPLPANPSLEFERKRAKKLLHDVQQGDARAPDAVAHARSRRVPLPSLDAFQLSHAQLMVAREYGFASWPQLVAYYRMWETHSRGPGATAHSREHYDFMVSSIFRQHANRQPFIARILATFVPRFYGFADAEIFAEAVTVEEIRLCVARMRRSGSWDGMMSSGEYHAQLLAPDEAPIMRALGALRARNRDALEALVETHPQLVAVPIDREYDSIIRNAILHEFKSGDPRDRELTDWLAGLNGDVAKTLRLTLSAMLTHCLRADTGQVEYFLERGADPAWVPPSGVSVLEHALLRYWNPAAVDLIAARVTHRDAFWIGAGVGDVRGTLSYVQPDGTLREAAHDDRPDFIAVGLAAPQRPNTPDRDVVWEAFYVAGINQRMAVIDALLSTGLIRIDDAPWGTSLMAFAEGNEIQPLVEALAARGARSTR